MRDQGIGMSKKDMKNLFKPFFTSESEANREMNTGGHGLGLSICKQICEKMGGQMQVKSVEQSGTKISFTLISPVDEVAQYNQISDPKTFLSRRARRIKKKIGINIEGVTGS